MMTGCTKLMTSSGPAIPANLKQPCPDLEELSGPTGKDWMIWAVPTIAKYNDCKARHSAVIKALN